MCSFWSIEYTETYQNAIKINIKAEILRKPQKQNHEIEKSRKMHSAPIIKAQSTIMFASTFIELKIVNILIYGGIV